jgi:ribonuclease D
VTDLIQNRADLDRTARALANAPTLFVDTEFESTRSGSELCLLQVGDGTHVHLVDTLTLRDLSPLGPVFGADGVEWVLHAGLQDVELLTRALAVPAPERLFDTQVAWSLTGVEHAVSLSYLVYRVLGKRTSKPHQADDWKRRPLPRAQLRYAASDVEYLPAIRSEIGRRLESLGRAPAAYEVAREVLLPQAAVPSALDLGSFRNAWQLGAQSQAALVHLIAWYNALDVRARADAPGSKVLLSIAMRLPQNADDLARVKGVPARWAVQHGRALVAALNDAASNADEAAHAPLEPPPYATEAETRVEGWLAFARAEVAVRASVAPELALPQRWMRLLTSAILDARTVDAAPRALSGWRRDLLLDVFVRFCLENPLALGAGPAR